MRCMHGKAYCTQRAHVAKSSYVKFGVLLAPQVWFISSWNVGMSIILVTGSVCYVLSSYEYICMHAHTHAHS